MFEDNIEWGMDGDEYERNPEATRFWEPGTIDPEPAVPYSDDDDEDGAEFAPVERRGQAPSGNTVHRIVAAGGEAHRKAIVAYGHQLAATAGTAAGGSAAGDPAAGGSARGTAIDAALGTLESLLDEPVRITVVTELANDPSRVELVFGVAVDVEETDRRGGEAIRFADSDLLPVHRISSLRIDIQ